MSSNSSLSIIDPVLVARKLQAAHNLENVWLAEPLQKNPLLAEIVWFVQYQSFQPGGLRDFIDKLLAEFPDKFVPSKLAKPGRTRAGFYTMEECCAAWNYIWDTKQRLWPPYRRMEPAVQEFFEWLELHCDGHLSADRVSRNQDGCKARLLDGFDKYNWSFLSGIFADLARDCLPDYLNRLCTDTHGWDYAQLVKYLRPDVPCGPIYCPELTEVLIDYMTLHATRVKARLAMTEVALAVFDALDFAWFRKKFVRIDGNSRFGKTESVLTWYALYPGRVRYVRTPSENSLTELIEALAEALGKELWPGDVLTVLRHGGLGWILDEAHFLFPVVYNPSSVPRRMNYVREHIVEKKSPCAIITTPQTYDTQKEKFKNMTEYNFEQFDGRLNRHIRLPIELGKRDLELVARLHFAELEQEVLQLIIGVALKADGFLQAMADIAELASWKAEKAEAKTIDFEHIKAAIYEKLPAGKKLLDDFCTLHAALTGNLPVKAAVESKKPKQESNRKTAAKRLRTMGPGTASSDQTT